MKNISDLIPTSITPILTKRVRLVAIMGLLYFANEEGITNTSYCDKNYALIYNPIRFLTKTLGRIVDQIAMILSLLAR